MGTNIRFVVRLQCQCCDAHFHTTCEPIWGGSSIGFSLPGPAPPGWHVAFPGPQNEVVLCPRHAKELGYVR